MERGYSLGLRTVLVTFALSTIKLGIEGSTPCVEDVYTSNVVKSVNFGGVLMRGANEVVDGEGKEKGALGGGMGYACKRAQGC